MNRKQFYQIMSMISMGLGFAWMKAFPVYPQRAIGFISIMISGFLFVEVLFYEEDQNSCDVYYPPICDPLIDQKQKCHYGNHENLECPPKGKMVCVCSGDHLKIDDCEKCPKLNDCDLNFTIIRDDQK